jgi:hypothetical protein
MLTCNLDQRRFLAAEGPSQFSLAAAIYRMFSKKEERLCNWSEDK